MTTVHAAVSVPQVRIPAIAGITSFVGHGDVFWRLLARGAVLLMLTLGIYRFWLTTDIRRYLWSNTQIADESFEYTGTARELLLGFLIAVSVLVPLYAAFFLLTLVLGDIWSSLGLVVLTFLGQYAVYRARRYRLSRTIYRGVRFHQAGSAWRYSICAVFWWSLVVLSLGLAYPFAQSRLEEFKMRHTFFGNLPGRFEGSGWRLLMRGLLLWTLAVVPLVIGAAATLLAIDWSALTSAAGGDDSSSRLEASGLAGAFVFAGLTGLWLLLSIAILYPIFQAMVLRWWVSGLRFGDIVVRSRLRTAQVYAIYARFVAYAAVFTLVAGGVAGIGALGLAKIAAGLDAMHGEIITTISGLAAYVAIALGYSTIYQATIKLGLWRCVVESLDVSNLDVLERVSAAGEAASPVGEGLADALNVGGI
jgi:uncharacterized membrane protein YjgN (DUF898 family)